MEVDNNEDLSSAPALILESVRAIEASDPDTASGAPFNVFAGKKETWMADRRGLVKLVLDRLSVLLDLDIEASPGPVELIRRGACDPIYTFIKDEPHKREKLEKNRYRIISCVSILDTLVERVLYNLQNKTEIDHCDFIPFKPGMGLHDEGKQALFRWFEDRAADYQPASTDVSAWDWSVTDWMLEDDAAYRVQVAGGEGSAWAKLVYAQHYCLAHKVFVLPSGEMFMQTEGGVLPSGCFNTSSTNSHMRHMLASHVQLRLGAFEEWTRAEGAQMGDDAQERFVDGMLEEYVKLGFTVKGVSRLPNGEYSFCSTHFKGNWRGEPEGWKKTLFRYLSKPKEAYNVELLRALKYDLRHHPGSDELVSRAVSFVSQLE